MATPSESPSRTNIVTALCLLNTLPIDTPCHKDFYRNDHTPIKMATLISRPHPLSYLQTPPTLTSPDPTHSHISRPHLPSYLQTPPTLISPDPTHPHISRPHPPSYLQTPPTLISPDPTYPHDPKCLQHDIRGLCRWIQAIVVVSFPNFFPFVKNMQLGIT